jgi:hypothetical protein
MDREKKKTGVKIREDASAHVSAQHARRNRGYSGQTVTHAIDEMRSEQRMGGR